MGIALIHGVWVVGGCLGSRENLVWFVSQNLCGMGSSYLLGTLVVGVGMQHFGVTLI